jgi:Iap family predicted aminopeptidase
MSVKFGEKELIPGENYLVPKNSNSCSGTFEVLILDKRILSDNKKFKKFKSKNHSEQFILIDTLGLNNKDFKETYDKIVTKNLLKAKGIITISEKLPIYSVSTSVNTFPLIVIKRESLPEKTENITVNIENEFIEDYETKNIVGYVKGEVDSFMVLTAHYDHLGRMGKETYFPGAHDNASGVALCLDLMHEFSNRKTIPHYSIAVILFTGEELGLIGSYYFVKNPVFPLEKIKFLLNLDLAGSGEDGIQIVNSTIFTEEYNLMVRINEENNYMSAIKTRGSAANSDHYFFYEAGIPSFYIYTLGAYKEYHNIYDKAETLPLNDYEDYFRLLEKFIDNLD